MNTNRHINTADCSEALTAKAASQLCNVSERHWWSLHSRGLVPRPVRLSRSVRWLRSELLTWLAAGAPRREKWEAAKAAAK